MAPRARLLQRVPPRARLLQRVAETGAAGCSELWQCLTRPLTAEAEARRRRATQGTADAFGLARETRCFVDDEILELKAGKMYKIIVLGRKQKIKLIWQHVQDHSL